MLEFNEYKRHGDASHAACAKGWTKDLSEDVIGKSSVIEILTHQKFGCVGVARDSVISTQTNIFSCHVIAPGFINSIIIGQTPGYFNI